jgi:hypothetical protein
MISVEEKGIAKKKKKKTTLQFYKRRESRTNRKDLKETVDGTQKKEKKIKNKAVFSPELIRF